VHPPTNLASQPPVGDRSGDAGKGHGRTGHAGTQFEPHTDARAKERGNFARQLADYLNEGVAAQRCNGLVLIASNAMLGELRPLLNSAAEKALKSSVASDLTSFQGPELTKRINQALQLSD
jgi:protein required for attachment to host cells